MEKDDCDDDDGDNATHCFFDHIYCINLKKRPDRWERMVDRMEKVLGERGQFLTLAMERLEAVDGASLLSKVKDDAAACACSSVSPLEDMVYCQYWDATNNARWDRRNISPPFRKKMTPGEIGCALSHVQLWQKLSQHPKGDATTMLILEDDVVFYPGNDTSTKPGFVDALSSLLKILPPDWDMLYFGFCNVGPRTSAVFESTSYNMSTDEVPVHIFRPTYGFYTHAYALKQSAALRLLKDLPVAAPLDVWLADNNWFGLNVYVSVVPSPNGVTGKRRGVSMIAQNRVDSDIVHSAHHTNSSDVSESAHE